MRTACLSFLAFIAALFIAALPARAMMNHGNAAPSAYSDRAFLSAMLAHHEGAVDMAELLLKSSRKYQDPKVAAWADAVIKVQQAEISEMKQLLKPLGGVEKSAYDPMKESMTHMLDEGADMNANMRFVKLMLPHHAMAVEMALPALVYSDNPKVLDLAEAIIIEQAKEMRQFKAWLLASDHAGH